MWCPAPNQPSQRSQINRTRRKQTRGIACKFTASLPYPLGGRIIPPGLTKVGSSSNMGMKFRWISFLELMVKNYGSCMPHRCVQIRVLLVWRTTALQKGCVLAQTTTKDMFRGHICAICCTRVTTSTLMVKLESSGATGCFVACVPSSEDAYCELFSQISDAMPH